MENEKQSIHWDEEVSRRYLDYGRYFVPAREQQMGIVVDLLKGLPSSSLVLEQLVWLKQAGFVDVDVHFFHTGHALISGWKKDETGKQEEFVNAQTCTGNGIPAHNSPLTER